MALNPFSNFLKSISSLPFYVLDGSISKSKYIQIDLSKYNHLLNKVDVSSSLKLAGFVSNHIKKHDAKLAHGGYLEVRNIYKRSHHFGSQANKARNIHLGIDLWCAEGTAVLAPLDGIVHSFKNNTNHGDYGPTIILKHNIKGIAFYTLYGHLSMKSIKNLKVGDFFKQGQQIATLGNVDENGDYSPHLHFQIIKDIQDYKGDYPGVCSKQDVAFYLANCPDPNLLLKL